MGCTEADEYGLIRLGDVLLSFGLSGVEEFHRQLRRPNHIRDALQVVGHCREADFSSCAAQPAA